MRGIRISLFTRIIFWFFLNLLLLIVILSIFFSYNFRFRPNSGLSEFFSGGIDGVARQISNDVNERSRSERNEVLARFGREHPGVEFFLFDSAGNHLGGRDMDLPAAVREAVTRPDSFGPQPGRKSGAPATPPPGPPPPAFVRTNGPTLYWFWARSLTYDADSGEPIRTRIVAMSDSFYGYGLFFNPIPWFVLTAIIVGVSVLFWFPLVRSITNSTWKITSATEAIADENFDVRIDDSRSDELGTLGSSINRLAKRLQGFVGGQKRFLGDISHELNSPLARMQFALGVLENRVTADDRIFVNDVREEVELMSRLVNELLTYSKAGMKAPQIALERLPLAPVVARAVAIESAGHEGDIRYDVPDSIEVLAHGEFLSRAIGNIVRNAIRYAGGAGPVTIKAAQENGVVELRISDVGGGVPEDALEKLFDPFYRIETHRSRETGGSGLGLAIVKTCVEACQGKISARNLSPSGFEVSIRLKSPVFA